MSKVRGVIQFGAQVEINSPIPIPEDAKEIIEKVEGFLDAALRAALSKSVGGMGFSLEILKTKVQVKVDRIE